MINFRSLRSRGTRERNLPNFVSQAREIEFFCKKLQIGRPSKFFQGLWTSYRENYFRLTMFRDIKLQFKLLSRRDSYIV